MTRWTPGSVYLTTLGYTTSIVIIMGTFAVQCVTSWPKASHLRQVSPPPPGLHTPGIFALVDRREHGTSTQRVFEDGAARWLPTVIAVAEGHAGRSRDTEGSTGGRRFDKADELSPRHLQTLARAAADLCGVDRALYWRLILRESGGRHYAADGSVLVSSAGAVGAAQVKPSTARELGLDAFDLWENLLAGACALRGHCEASGSWEKALHSYHAGRWRKRTTAATIAYGDDIMGSAQ